MKNAIVVLLAAALLAGCAGSPPQTAPASVRTAERYLRNGVQAFHDSDYAGAAALFGKAHGLYRSLDHGEGMTLAAINLAETALLMGSYARADAQIRAAGAMVEARGLQARFGTRLALLEATAAYGLGEKERALARLAPLLPAFAADHQPTRPVQGDIGIAAVVLRTRMAFDAGEGESSWTYRLENVIRNTAPADAMLRARLWRFQGLLAQRAGDSALARERLEAALALYRQHANRPGTAAVLYELGGLALAAQQWSEAQDYLERALYIHTWILDRPGAAQSLQALAEVHQATGAEAQARVAVRWSSALRGNGAVNWPELRDEVIPAP
jgi:tetratricopeptide (TPR) repeat protein